MKIKKIGTVFFCSLLLLSCGKVDTAKANDSGNVVVESVDVSEKQPQVATAKPIELDIESFSTKIVNYKEAQGVWKYLGDKPAIIDFYASWCGPCRQIAPILEELATEYGDSIYVYKVDVDKYGELAGLFGVNSIPALLFIPQGGNPDMKVGLLSKTQLTEIINKFLLKK